MLDRRAVLAGLLALPVGACTSISPAALNTLGSRVDKGQVDFAHLHNMASRASDAWMDEAALRAKYPDLVKAVHIKSEDVHYTFGEDHRRKLQYLAMPGTASIQDWLEDFDIFLKPDARNGIPLHRGFEDGALAVYAEVKPLLRKDYHINLAGYSMGGGIGAVLTMYMVEDGFSVTASTFGQPRVTNAAGAARMAGLPITRVVNADDFVSMVPVFPFEQFGQEVILHDGADYTYLSGADANQISIGEIWRLTDGLSVANHASELYVSRLAEKVRRATAVPYLARLPARAG
ncbi:MAG: lipase family protein [Devosia sp.]